MGSMPWVGGAHRRETPPFFRVQSLWSRAVESPCLARGLFSDGEEPYDRRLLPARLPVGGGDRVLIVQDSQALEGFEQLVLGSRGSGRVRGFFARAGLRPMPSRRH